ncbi:MAG TPA: hypothetical protein VKU02_27025 [Gemmataceae bacterium]|nr:hypothetical protein [Gemmataceae bacterium]
MNHEWIASCLQLPSNQWPPNHYTILGLEPGDGDVERIEQSVRERMEKLRRYQLAHPEQVTEGMNRLAQALVCLTDPVAKKAYDAALFPRPPKPPVRRTKYHRPSLSEAESEPEEPVVARASSGWLLLAWILWLSIGAVGLVALAVNFAAIRESYLGEAPKRTPAKKSPLKTSRLEPSEQRTFSFRE